MEEQSKINKRRIIPDASPISFSRPLFHCPGNEISFARIPNGKVQHPANAPHVDNDAINV